MTAGMPPGPGERMLTLSELCQWLNITERHARKLVERDAIPYRKVGRLLRFVESEIEEWSRPAPRPGPPSREYRQPGVSAKPKRSRARLVLPKSLIEWPTEQESGHGERQSA
jgi:excisionase family DNA binding protein